MKQRLPEDKLKMQICTVIISESVEVWRAATGGRSEGREEVNRRRRASPSALALTGWLTFFFFFFFASTVGGRT